MLSFIQFHTQYFGEDGGKASLAGLEIPHCQQQCQIVLLAPHQATGPSKVEDVVTPLGAWSTSEPLSHGVSSRICLANLSWDILGICQTQGRRKYFSRGSN